eukprot:12673932-Alexandrium_andersonii.AAC.1
MGRWNKNAWACLGTHAASKAEPPLPCKHADDRLNLPDQAPRGLGQIRAECHDLAVGHSPELRNARAEQPGTTSSSSRRFKEGLNGSRLAQSFDASDAWRKSKHNLQASHSDGRQSSKLDKGTRADRATRTIG